MIYQVIGFVHCMWLKHYDSNVLLSACAFARIYNNIIFIKIDFHVIQDNFLSFLILIDLRIFFVVKNQCQVFFQTAYNIYYYICV